MIIVIDSEANRDRLFDVDGKLTEVGKATNAKFQPVLDEMKKLGTITSDVYTDWLVY